MKTDRAIAAMLLPFGDPDAIGPAFIEKLLVGFENSRAHRASDLAQWASDDSYASEPETVAAIRAKYLDLFLNYTAHDMKAVLLSLMDEDDPRAAALFLHGHEQRYWKATAMQVRYARELLPAEPETPKPKEKPKVKTATSTARVQLEPMLACLRASHAMSRELNDPNSTDVRRIAAINVFFDTLELNGYGHVKDIAAAGAKE